jgi:hypothetical protein
MHAKGPSVALLRSAAAAFVFGATTAAAQQQEPYAQTLTFGTGLINTPVAWVSPVSADGWFTISGKRIQYYGEQDANFATQFNTNVAMDTHWWGRLSLGISAYSQNPEWGFFGQGLLLRDGDVAFLPAIAVGFRNLGPYPHEERFLIGHDISLQGDRWEPIIAPHAENFSTAPTFFGVATKEFSLAGINPRMPESNISLSLGWGNGLFLDDGELGEVYNSKGTIVGGLFMGARFLAHPTLNSTLTFMAENDGWDWNAGVVYDWRGLSAGLYGTELEEGAHDPAATGLAAIYNYRKINFSLGYSGNIIDVSRGVILRTRITELTREQQRLRLEIARRDQRIAGLQVALARAQAGDIAQMESRRAELDALIEAEREQRRILQQRLDEILAAPPTTPPPTSPPPTSTTPAPLSLGLIPSSLSTQFTSFTSPLHDADASRRF